MKNLITYLYNNNVIRYIFFGGLATLVNVGSFFILKHTTELDSNTRNVIAISIAILFAYVTNKLFVFESKTNGFKETFFELQKFISGRLFGMLIEIGGFIVLFNVMGINELVSKILVQFLVLVVNYFWSKYFVFRNSDDEKSQ